MLFPAVDGSTISEATNTFSGSPVNCSKLKWCSRWIRARGLHLEASASVRKVLALVWLFVPRRKHSGTSDERAIKRSLPNRPCVDRLGA